MSAYPGQPDQGYPAYPPQQQPAYPPPAGYPPQQLGYPQQPYPQQPAYPQPGYPQDYKGDAPPPYFGGAVPQQQPYPQQQPMASQQANTNVVVVTSQPTPVVTHTTVQPTGDHYLILSIVLTVICLFCGTWYSLFCTVPAIFLAISAREAESRGDVEGARSKGRIALILNIVAMIWWVVALVIIIGSIAGSIASASSCNYYYYYYNNYYRSYTSSCY